MNDETSVALRVPPGAKRVDVALAAGLVIFAVIEGLVAGAADDNRLILCVGGAATAIPVAWRRSHPGLAAVTALTPSAVAALLGTPLEDLISAFAAVLLVWWSLGLYGSGRPFVISALLSYGLLACSVVAAGNPAADMLYVGTVMGLVVVPAHLLRRRLLEVYRLTARAVHAEHESQERVRTAALEERTRVARELHDIIGHGVSLMVVHAAAAERHLSDAATARRSLAAVQDVGRLAVADLARLLGLLRDDHAEIGLAPQPGVADLDDLAEKARAGGDRVTLHVDGAICRVPDALGLTVYRIVQEALTNARKHAPGAPVAASITIGDREITVDVRNTRPAGTPAVAGTGHGLTGLQERVRMFGGTLRYGHEPDGGFALRTTLPREPHGTVQQ